jgi:RNA polymerase sigma-70 factor (ECF subfamily)
MLTALSLLASSAEVLETAPIADSERRQRQGAASAQPTKLMMRTGPSGDQEKARRFREIALPHLDDVYTLARFLMRDSADAEDAAHECYVRALRHFDTYRGPAIKPWLFAILRNICRGEFARRSSAPLNMGSDIEENDGAQPLWQEEQPSPESQVLHARDAETIRRMVADLPPLFREAIVLREINDLSYREIAEVVGAPVGTVMSRLARARSMLRQAWIAEEEGKAK